MKKFLLSCFVAMGIGANAQIGVNEGFEGTTTPSGWAYTGFARTTSTGYPCTGTAAIRKNLYGTTTNITANAIYTSTASNGNAIDVSFSYSARGFSTTTPVVTGNLKVEYSVNGGTSYTLLGSQINFTAGSALCTSFSGSIPAGTVPASSNFKFRITGNNTGSGDWYLTVDDVKLTQIATCYAPTGINASSITNSSASINWTSSTTVPGNGYDVYYSTTSTTPAGTATPNVTGVTTLSTPISGLLSNTTYYAWVRSSCSSSDISSWSSNPATFTTACGSSALPYTQNFESVTVPAIPACTAIQNAGTGNNWLSYSFTTASLGFSAGKALRYPYNGTNPANAWFYTQGLNLTAGTTYVLKFRAGSSDVSFTEKLKVAFGTAANNAAMTTVIADYPEVTHAGSTYNTVYFTPTTTDIYYVGFNAYSAIDQAYLYLDDISVDVAPNCKVASNAIASSITETSALINWTASDSAPANGYDLYYSTSKTAPTSSTTPNFEAISGTSQALNSLSAGTTYNVWVRSSCSTSDKSDWTDIRSFSTTCPAGNYNVPYTQNIEQALVPALPNCTTAQNLGTGNNWASYNNATTTLTGAWLICPYSSTSASNAWYYTAGINLEAGKQYKISYRYAAGGLYVDKLKVAYGTSASSTAMTTTLADYPSLTTSTINSAEHTITAPTTGVYYFGFNAYSAADQNLVAIDDISIVLKETLAVSDVNKSDVSVYPNPFTDILKISDVKGVKSVSVSDVSGREVKSLAPSAELNLSNLKTGLYIVNLKMEDGSVKSFKAIKK